MKFLILTVVLGLFAATLSAQEPKTTAAVMDLQAEEGVSQSVSRILSDCLRTHLVNTQKFTLVTRENMEQILKEQNFQMSGCTSNECVVQVGQLLGVRKMLAGSIGKVGATYLITLKIIDVESGKIEKAEIEKCPGDKEDALIASIKNLTEKVQISPEIQKKIEALKDESSDVRSWAARGLGEIKDKFAIPSLIKALKNDGNSDVRCDAAWALVVIGDTTSVIPALIKALKDDESSDVRSYVAYSWQVHIHR